LNVNEGHGFLHWLALLSMNWAGLWLCRNAVVLNESASVRTSLRKGKGQRRADKSSVLYERSMWPKSFICNGVA